MYFERVHEAESFYQILRESCSDWKAFRRRGDIHTIHIVPEDELDWENCKQKLSQLLSNIYIKHREIPAIQTILEKTYRFTNAEEIERITSLAMSLIEKDEDIYEHRIHQHELHDILQTIFMLHMEKGLIRFDSIVHFRFHHYIEQLSELVGLAIDEFKREEDYQSFIHSVREFIARKEPEIDVIYVLEGEQYYFFREDGSQYTETDLEELMSRFPLYIFALQEEEWNISPLIMLAPNHVYLFGDDPTEPRMTTVINIFQEHCTFFPTAEFPFPAEEEKGS
ncbi:putative sporulation protein YtxC [Gracilibacillus ureilyticus]|uniref:putative sporulation protein YtxC n=1 Tax=Gracilibacillus ureilyticus TaxID=531814 RepID=UPI001FE0498E|nr:putative sporulation protein YtxC [Gracilibacillus ureilyticus]